MNKKLPVISDSATVGNKLPSISKFGIGAIDTLARGLAQQALNETAAPPARPRWGLIIGDIELQIDLQEELAIAEHALCGGI